MSFIDAEYSLESTPPGVSLLDPLDPGQIAAFRDLHLARIAATPPGACRLLMPPTFYLLAEGSRATRALNAAMRDIAAQAGDRAQGFFALAEPLHGEIALAEMEEAAALGAAGILLTPGAQGVLADAPEIAALARHAQALGLVLAVRSTPGSANAVLWRLWQLAAACADAPLLVLGALASWDHVQILIARGRADNILYSTAGLSIAGLMPRLIEAIGIDRFAYGSGLQPGSEAAMRALHAAGLDDPTGQALLGGNIATLIPAQAEALHVR